MQNLYKKFIPIILLFFMVFIPSKNFASTVYLETPHKDFFVDDTILIDVKIDSKDKEINTVEGIINLNYPLESVLIKDINFSGSNFTLWPNKPILSEDLKTIRFVGGSPNGLRSNDAILFKIVLNLKKVGQITLSPKDIFVYLNDGKATKDIVDIKDLNINILPSEEKSFQTDDWNTLILEDRISPRPFEIIIGQDNSVFGGKKFLTFNAIDEQSGVKYYEVIEGKLPAVRSNGTYVLQNQDKKEKIIVIAYDAAGNKQKEIYNPNLYLNILTTIFIILILLVLYILINKRKNVFV